MIFVIAIYFQNVIYLKSIKIYVHQRATSCLHGMSAWWPLLASLFSAYSNITVNISLIYSTYFNQESQFKQLFRIKHTHKDTLRKNQANNHANANSSHK